MMQDSHKVKAILLKWFRLRLLTIVLHYFIQDLLTEELIVRVKLLLDFSSTSVANHASI